MGALIVLELAIRRAEGQGGGPGAVKGWISSGAGIEPAGIAKPHLVAIARLLSGIAPRFRLDIGLSPEAMSHDPDVIAAYRDDPFVQRRATVRWGAEALDAIARIKHRSGSIEDPLLVIHGGADPLARPDGSRWLASTVGAATLRVYEGALHEPHNDQAFGDVAGDIANWIGEHA
jgi:alpha-beta hydrolase superfamily lysophospholipase